MRSKINKLIPVFVLSLLARSSSPSSSDIAANIVAAKVFTGTATTVAISGTAKERRQLLASLRQDPDQVIGNGRIAKWIIKGTRASLVAHTTSSANPVHVLINRLRHVVIDHMAHVRNVQTTRGHRRSDEHFSRTLPELPECQLPLALQPIAMDGCGGELRVGHECRKEVCVSLSLNKNQSSLWILLVQQFSQFCALLLARHFVEVLLDIRAGTAENSDRHEHVVIKERLGKQLDFGRECCREHEGLVLALCHRSKEQGKW